MSNSSDLPQLAPKTAPFKATRGKADVAPKPVELKAPSGVAQGTMGNAAVNRLLQGPEHFAGQAGREKLRTLASRLLQVQLKADALARMGSGEANWASQANLLAEHLDRVTGWLGDQLAASEIDPVTVRAIEVGIDAGGLAADLMYLDRLGAAGGISRVSRAGANRGLAWAWKAMRLLAADINWATGSRAEADESLRSAAFHRDTVEDLLRTATVLKAGVVAAQMADIAVSAPQLIATGSGLLKALASWLTEGGGGGGFGLLRLAAGGGPGVFTLVSGGRTLVLTAEQVEELVRAGILSAKALAIYRMATSGSGGLVGPYGQRPPGSKSRYSDEEIAKEYLKEIGRKVPTGERAAEELGVTARALRKVEEYHHLLVQQLRKWFKARGVNIDEFTVRLSADEHRWIHNEYRWNDLWKEFMLKNPQASPEEIIAAMQRFQKQVGLEGLEIVPYPR